MLIPGLEFLNPTTQQSVMRAAIITTMLVFFFQFCFSITNIIRYLILENRFFTAIPLTFFYCLVSVYLLFKVAYIFLVVGIVERDNAFGLIFT